MSTNRYRWNIAHELGHVMLGHHKKHVDSRLYRNQLSKRTYKVLESEADMFAAYLLVPHIVLNCLEVKEDYEIAELCKVSDTASLYRANDISIWMKRGKATEYDFTILSLYYKYVESEHKNKNVHRWLREHRTCQFCSCNLNIFSYDFCPICGKHIEIKYKARRTIMQYPGIDIDDAGRALECPVCHNTELYEDGEYCVICGNDISNYCSSAEDPFSPKCNHLKILPGNARFCPFCGSETTFYLKGYLSPYKAIENDEIIEPPF